MGHNLNGMRADISTLIDDWGKNCVISRFSSTLNASGRHSGSYVGVSSGTYWIQPVQGMSSKEMEGFHEETTHIMFARVTANVQADDKVLPSGETYLYDVLAPIENQPHTMFQLKRVKRS